MDALSTLSAAGITLRAEGDALKASGQLTDEHRWFIREHKAELLALLSAPEPPPLEEADRGDIEEAVEERAAILEHLGRMPRNQAERVAGLAGRYYEHHWGCPACRAGTVLGAQRHHPCSVGAELWQKYASTAKEAGR